MINHKNIINISQSVGLMVIWGVGSSIWRVRSKTYASPNTLPPGSQGLEAL